jgi:hypothetical protein
MYAYTFVYFVYVYMQYVIVILNNIAILTCIHIPFKRDMCI